MNAAPKFRPGPWRSSARVDTMTPETTKLVVASPVGEGLFLETTSQDGEPFEAAVQRGDAEILEAAARGEFRRGLSVGFPLSRMRRLGIRAFGDPSPARE